MLKWFAPLLLLAGKPELLIRLVVGALAVAVLLGGVWLISNIALTFDTLKNPYIAAAYGTVLLCFFLVVGMTARLRLRSLGSTPKAIGSKKVEQLLPNEIVAKRARELSAKWEAEGRRPAAAPEGRLRQSVVIAPPRAMPPVRATLTVIGPAYAGKTALIAQLVADTRAQPPETSDVVRLVDAGAIDGDERHVAPLLEAAAATDGVLFVVDQDLRAPEVAAIRRLTAKGKPLYLVLNKADQFNAADLDAILVSIRKKLPAGFPPANAVLAAVAPSPVNREVEDARGAVRIETRRLSADVDALTKLLVRAVQPTAGHALQFTTSS
jgi:GTPase SAR1 family protein